MKEITAEQKEANRKIAEEVFKSHKKDPLQSSDKDDIIKRLQILEDNQKVLYLKNTEIVEKLDKILSLLGGT